MAHLYFVSGELLFIKLELSLDEKEVRNIIILSTKEEEEK